MELLRKRIREELNARKWTLVKLAKLIHVSPVYVGALLKGKNRFNEDIIIRIANAFNIEVFELFTDDTDSYRRGTYKELFKAMDSHEGIRLGILSEFEKLKQIYGKEFKTKQDSDPKILE